MDSLLLIGSWAANVTYMKFLSQSLSKTGDEHVARSDFLFFFKKEAFEDGFYCYII